MISRALEPLTQPADASLTDRDSAAERGGRPRPLTHHRQTGAAEVLGLRDRAPRRPAVARPSQPRPAARLRPTDTALRRRRAPSFGPLAATVPKRPDDCRAPRG